MGYKRKKWVEQCSFLQGRLTKRSPSPLPVSEPLERSVVHYLPSRACAYEAGYHDAHPPHMLSATSQTSPRTSLTHPMSCGAAPCYPCLGAAPAAPYLTRRYKLLALPRPPATFGLV